MTIAPAAQSEREWCAGLMASTGPWLRLGRGIEHCRAACAGADCELFVIRAEREPRGFLLLHPAGLAGSPYIRALAVTEEFRGSGAGSRLLAFAEDYCRPFAAHLFLCVSSFNPRARALYERSGYSAVGDLPDYVVAGASEIILMKRLRPTSTPR